MKHWYGTFHEVSKLKTSGSQFEFLINTDCHLDFHLKHFNKAMKLKRKASAIFRAYIQFFESLQYTSSNSAFYKLLYLVAVTNRLTA